MYIDMAEIKSVCAQIINNEMVIQVDYDQYCEVQKQMLGYSIIDADYME